MSALLVNSSCWKSLRVSIWRAGSHIKALSHFLGFYPLRTAMVFRFLPMIPQPMFWRYPNSVLALFNPIADVRFNTLIVASPAALQCWASWNHRLFSVVNRCLVLYPRWGIETRFLTWGFLDSPWNHTPDQWQRESDHGRSVSGGGWLREWRSWDQPWQWQRFSMRRWCRTFDVMTLL